MDISTDVIVTAAVSGAAGGFIESVASRGFQWIIDLVSAQSPEMQTIARKNLENFVIRLAERVERLEREIPTNKSEIFKDSLNHPGSALLIKKAIVSSAITDNEDKHEILAELIAQRLAANADDMIALAGAAACPIVDCLSTRQIKILAVLTTVKDIRPSLKIKNIDNYLEATKYVMTWWQSNITPLVNDGVFDSATSLDYEHLAAMGCIRISIGSIDLLTVLSNGIFESEYKLEEPLLLLNQNWYTLLKKHWSGLGHCTATSTGRIIGILHRDTKLKTNTKINW